MARNFMNFSLDMQDEDPITGETAEQQAAKSPEEDAAAAGEAQTNLSEAIAASDEVDHFSDVADALEDTAVILDTLPEADQQHVALAQTIASMAVAGQPDADSNVIVSSNESFVGRRVSTEGFKETARKIWETIKRWMKQIWAKIEAFFYKNFGRIPRMRKSLDAAEAQLTAAESKPREDKKITLTSSLSQMMIANDVVKDLKKYQTALGEMTNVVKDVFGYAGKQLADNGEKVADALSDFDASEAKSSLSKVAMAMITAVPAVNKLQAFKRTAAPFTTSTAASGLSSKFTEALPGNICMRVSAMTGAAATSAETSKLAAFVSMVRSLGITSIFPDKAKDVPTSIDIDTPDIGVVRDCIGLCRRMLDDMETFYRGKSFKDIKDAQDKINKAGDKISTSIAKVKPEDLKPDDLSYYRQANNTAGGFVQTTLRTFGSISGTAMASASFVCVVASKTASAYRNK